jgi:hypothetical protein
VASRPRRCSRCAPQLRGHAPTRHRSEARACVRGCATISPPIPIERIVCHVRHACGQVFFAERKISKIDGLGADVKPAKVTSAAVIGAGTMGGGIAMCFADAGIDVTLVDMSSEAVERGVAIIRSNYEATAKKGRMSEAQVEARMGRITPASSYDHPGLANADVVVEAAFETMAVKRQVFGMLDKHCKPSALLATNTSTLSIDEIGVRPPSSCVPTALASAHRWPWARACRHRAPLNLEAPPHHLHAQQLCTHPPQSHCPSVPSPSATPMRQAATARPESVVGMHFFSPANVMPLLENVRSDASSDVSVATAMALGKKLKKKAVLARSCFGFIGNRMLEVRVSSRLLVACRPCHARYNLRGACARLFSSCAERPPSGLHARSR